MQVNDNLLTIAEFSQCRASDRSMIFRLVPLAVPFTGGGHASDTLEDIPITLRVK